MTTLLLDWLGLWAVMAVAALALFGWGRLTLGFLGVRQPKQIESSTVWLGFCVVLGSVETLHLFLPIDWKVSLFFAVVGVSGAYAHRRVPSGSAVLGMLCDVWCRTSRQLRQYPLPSLLLCLVIAVWCLRAMATPNNYDSGLYHFQSVRWMNEQPIVFGLGNLHWRLALNQSYFGFLALLNIAPFWNKGYAAGGLLLLLLTLATTLEIGFTQPGRWRNVFGAAVLVFLGLVAGSTANPSPDNAVALLEIAIFLFLFCFLKQDRAEDTGRVRLATVLVFLCSAVVTTKFSSAGFAAGCLGVVFVTLVKFRALAQVLSVRFLLLMAVLVTVHVVRGYILSGAPLFPATWFGAWQLPWAVPPEMAKFETAFIYSWARLPGADMFAPALRDGTWVFIWFKALGSGSVALFVVATGLAVFNFSWLLYKKQACREMVVYALYAPTVCALLFWFVTAPDVRFLGAALVLYCTLSVYLTVSQFQSMGFFDAGSFAKNCGRYFAPFVFTLACLLSLRYVGLNSISLDGWAALPLTPTLLKTTDTGATIYLPEVGNQCWNAALPCASLFNHELRTGQKLSHLLFTVKTD